MARAIQRSTDPSSLAWSNAVYATAALPPHPLVAHVNSKAKDAAINKMVLTCLGAASAVLIGTALLGVSMQDSATRRPFVDKSKAERILAMAGVLPEHAPDITPRPSTPIAAAAPSQVNTLTSIMAASAPEQTAPTPAIAPSTPIEISPTHLASAITTAPAPSVPQTLRQRLDALITQDKYDDAVVLAYSEAPKLVGRDNEMRRGELLTWLHAHETSGKMPILFTIARIHAASDNIESAAKWYMAASITGLLDASRCQDPQAAKAVRQLEEQFPDVRSYLKADAALRRNAVKFALEVEERLKNREPATWIAAHTTSSTGSAFVTDPEWQTRREQYRKALQGYLESK